MGKFICLSDNIYQALHDAGILSEEPHNVRRAVIDLTCHQPARIYYETFADDKLIEVLVGSGLTAAFEKAPASYLYSDKEGDTHLPDLPDPTNEA